MLVQFIVQWNARCFSIVAVAVNVVVAAIVATSCFFVYGIGEQQRTDTS